MFNASALSSGFSENPTSVTINRDIMYTRTYRWSLQYREYTICYSIAVACWYFRIDVGTVHDAGSLRSSPLCRGMQLLLPPSVRTRIIYRDNIMYEYGQGLIIIKYSLILVHSMHTPAMYALQTLRVPRSPRSLLCEP